MAMTKAQWLEKNAFSPEGLTYIVFGDNTYAIKDWLKEQGCKYHKELGWHSPVPLDMPVGYGMVSFEFNDLFQWGEKTGTAYPYVNTVDKVQQAIDECMPKSLSEFMGVEGERLRNLTATVKSSRGFQGKYGWTNLYTFQIGENILSWFTSTEHEFEDGQLVILTGTVKKHEEYRGVKTTQLSRCIVKALE